MNDLTSAETPDPTINQRSKPLDAPMLVSEWGGRYTAQLGIQLDNLEAGEIYKWLIAAILYGARISEKIATHTWQLLERNALLTPECAIHTGWDGVVALLDQGGYARYDYKTATKLLAVSQTLLDQYAGDLNQLHAAARDCDDLERRIMALGKGIGPVTTQIFLRELRGRWDKATPSLAQPAFQAARELGYLPKDCYDDDQLALTHLQAVWVKSGASMTSFPDFEAALVRYGLWLRHQKNRIKHLK